MGNSTKKLLNKLEKKVNSLTPNPKFIHDKYIIITLEEAITALKEGNYGVGAVLVHEKEGIILSGHNHVFKPYFRSDLHAEMDVMTKFEERFKNIKKMDDYILFSSLEPCPMCFSRLIISGVKKVYYAAIDKNGGMVHRLDCMPPEMKEFIKRQKFGLAKCSQELKDIALQIFLSTAKENNQKIQDR